MTRALICLALIAIVVFGAATRFQWEIPWIGGTGSPITYVADTGQPAIVCLGDSLTYGTDAPRDQSYPAWLQRRLDAEGYNWRVINAGISGNRIADGLARLSSDVLAYHPRVVIVELGSNDPAHTPESQWQASLQTIVARLEAHGSRVILAGLDEPGMGDVYRRIAASYHVPLVWFIARVARYPSLWGADGHHPNGRGYRLVMQSFWPVLQPLLHGA